MSRFLAAATLVAAVQALAADGKPSKVVDALVPFSTFHIPHITPGISIKEVQRRESSDDVVLIAPDNTCGYVSGRAGAPFTCNNDYTCAFVIQSTFGAVGCCEGDVCGLRATCMDYQQVVVSSSCDNGCMQDTFTAKCTNTAMPYCGTVTFFSGIRDYYCDSLSISTPQQLYTTYSGETGRTFQQIVASSTQSASEGGSFTLSSQIETAVPSITNGVGGNDNGDSANDNSGNSGNNVTQKKSSSPPIGAIVGGVVGGVAVLALIGLGIFFIIRRNKNKTDPAQPMQQSAAAPGGGVPPAPGYPPQPTYDNNVAYGQQGYQQPPAGYNYPTEQKPTGFVSMGPTAVPDRHDSTSPVSQTSDMGHSPSSPNANWGPPPPVSAAAVPPNVHEAGGNVVGARDYNSNHHGQFHEMA